MLSRRLKNYTYEDLFVDRYDQLLQWALRLTDNDVHLAEDLVHDVFVKFVLTQPDLELIDNLDGYLFTSLRNTYRSQLRRPGYISNKQFTMIEFDSVDLVLAHVEYRQLFQVRQELRLICQYACSRKDSSKSGSVLILRFFLGYFPGEIAEIFKSERHSIAESLRVARAEVRLFLENPQKLGFTNQGQFLTSFREAGSITTEDLLEEFRNKIFSACNGECFSLEQLRDIYIFDKDKRIDRQQLAHIVSCPRCLDIVNKILGLPLLIDRNPTDSNGKDPGNGRGNQNGSNQSLNRIRRRATQVFEHDLKELRIVVNGKLIGSQEINGIVNKQTLTLSEIEPIEFIEVFSHQWLRLAYMVVDQISVRDFETYEIFYLSDERRIEILLNIKGIAPELQVIFVQPQFNLSSVTSLTEKAEIDQKHEQSNILKLIESVFRWFITRPQGVLAIALILVMSFAVINYLSNPTAGDILKQTIAREASIAIVDKNPNLVFHKIINIEELRSDGSIVTMRRVEIWRNIKNGLEVRRIFDEKGKLLSRTLKEVDDTKSVVDKIRNIKHTPTVDDLLNLNLTAIEFSSLVGSSSEGTLEEKDHSYLVGYNQLYSGLVSTSLLIDRMHGRVTQQRFVFNYANTSKVIRLVEKFFEKLPLNTKTEKIFVKEDDSSNATDNKDGLIPPQQSLFANSTPSGTTMIAPFGVEIKALMLLHKIGADLGREVALQRTPDGKLTIEAIVGTSNRKNQILNALTPLAENKAIIIRIKTMSEANKNNVVIRNFSKPIIIQEYNSISSKIPASAELRKYFINKTRDNTDEMTVEAEILNISNKILSRSHRATLSSYAMKDLIDRLASNESENIDSADLATWHSLLADHVHNLFVHTSNMRLALQNVLGYPNSHETHDEVTIKYKDSDDLVKSIKRLFELQKVVDRIVRSSFINLIQPEATPPPSMKQLWQEIVEAEKLSRQIYKALSLKQK